MAGFAFISLYQRHQIELPVAGTIDAYHDHAYHGEARNHESLHESRDPVTALHDPSLPKPPPSDRMPESAANTSDPEASFDRNRPPPRQRIEESRSEPDGMARPYAYPVQQHDDTAHKHDNKAQRHDDTAHKHDDTAHKQSAISVKVNYGDSLISILSRHKVERNHAHKIIFSLRNRYNPRHLRIGDTVRIVFAGNEAPFATTENTDGSPPNPISSIPLDDAKPRVKRIEISRHDQGEVIGVEYQNGHFRDYARHRNVVRKIVRAEGTIQVNFSRAAIDAYVPDDMIEEVINSLQHHINFQRDTRTNDRFRLIYEAIFDRERVDYIRGKLLFAEIDLAAHKNPYRIFRFTRKNGKEGLFDDSGKDVTSSFFLSAPITGARISSRYGTRKDPFLNYRRMHYGVDYAAPKGTVVRSAANGKVTKIGRYGNYGKYVEITHEGNYKTAYAHLNSYAKNLKKGSHVTRGQAIATVGSTGRSTGPHLHFEVRIGNKRVNPMTFKILKKSRLDKKEMARFQKVMDQRLASYASLEASDTTVALGGG